MVVTIERKQDFWGAVVKAELIDHLGNEVVGTVLSLPNMTEEEERRAVWGKIAEHYDYHKKQTGISSRVLRKIRRNRESIKHEIYNFMGVPVHHAFIEIDGKTYRRCAEVIDSNFSDAKQHAERQLLGYR